MQIRARQYNTNVLQIAIDSICATTRGDLPATITLARELNPVLGAPVGIRSAPIL